MHPARHRPTVALFFFHNVHAEDSGFFEGDKDKGGAEDLEAIAKEADRKKKEKKEQQKEKKRRKKKSTCEGAPP